MAISIGSLTIQQADVIVAGITHGPQVAAVYAAASRLSLALSLPVLVVATRTAPHAAARSTLTLKGQQEVQRWTALATVLTLVGSLIFILCGETLMGRLFGDYYTRGGSVLWILGVGILAQTVTGPCGVILTMLGRETQVGVAVTLICVALVPCLFLGARLGLPGIAIASTAGTAFQSSVLWYMLFKGLGIRADCIPSSAARKRIGSSCN